MSDTNPPVAHQLTPDQAERIRAATISNIVKKIKKGGTPTVAEQKMLDEATATAGTISLRTAVCSIKDLADLFGYTTQRVDQLVDEGLVVKRSRGKYAVWESIKGLILHRDTKKKNQWDGEDGGDYEVHRARLTAAKADVAEMQRDTLRGTVHEAGAVETVWTDMLMNCRSKLLAIPQRWAPRLRQETDLAVVQEILETAITEALNELASYDPDRITGQYIQAHREEVDATAQADGVAVG